MRFLVLMALAALVGCGREHDGGNDIPTPGESQPEQQATTPDTSPEPQPVPYSMALASAAALPACDAAHQQQLVYLLAEKQFQTCQDGKWAVVEIATQPTGPTLAEIKNRLATISLGDKLTELLPEVREVLLGSLATHESDTHDDCLPKLPGDIYNIRSGQYSFQVEFRAGVVDSICDGGSTCEKVSCADR